jgi:hypothetical protein
VNDYCHFVACFKSYDNEKSITGFRALAVYLYLYELIEKYSDLQAAVAAFWIN